MGALTAVILATALLPASDGWEEVDDDDGIKVWAREVPGSDVREVKAEAIFDVSAKRVWAVLLDSSKYIEFMPYLIEARIVGKHARGEYQYQRLDPPIVDQRDYTVRVVLEEDETNGTYRRNWSPANDKGPKLKEDVIRVQVNQGSWTVVSEGGKARVTYYLYTNPGGSIPDWVANKANSTSVPTLMAAVRNRSRDPKWRRDE